MPLYIRDEAVADLARQVKDATGAQTVTAAVRDSLQRALVDAKKASLRASIDEVVARADAMGPSDHSFDMKEFMDELSGE